ncbi:hypothetical protein [Halotia branconii]|uniref:Uncharacterized protein n=1 Tax=Halotia branconii CENA392 TaxID=1539056 RepID=A0AAJ6NSU7_9CYAN|nr:hypothetical protein [Halotia branconii]WGV26083.1 hypothetical protein QI031_00755 [Halotia branconii CENA392]
MRWPLIPFHFKVDTFGQAGEAEEAEEAGEAGGVRKVICICNLVKWYETATSVFDFKSLWLIDFFG